jgi:beta-lactamase regulating signal transducer with metallopeptidase domain
LILSSGLLRTLSPEQLAGVLEHEVAHYARRDNLDKLLLSLCSYSSLAFPLSRLLVSWRSTEVEMICDEVAAVRTSEPLEIAEALVKLRRHTMANQITAAPLATHSIASSFVSASALTFQRRVDRLLALVDVPASSSGEKPSSLPITALVVLALSMVTLWASLVFAPLSVHHAAEALIRILK